MGEGRGHFVCFMPNTYTTIKAQSTSMVRTSVRCVPMAIEAAVFSENVSGMYTRCASRIWMALMLLMEFK